MRPLVWFGPVFESSGYADEVRGLTLALEAANIPVCLSANAVESTGFRESLPAQQRTLLEQSCARTPAGEFVQVQHATIDCFNPPHPRAVYSIGRSMFETDSLPSHWVSGANALDELWVPTAFNADTFRAAGVRVPIHVIPGGVDSEFFAPHPEPLHIAGARGTVFLSVFEWRLRKGWDVLLRAWANAFAAGDDATLVLRTFPVGESDGRRNADVINARIDTFLREQCDGRTRADVAPIVVLGDRVDAAALPALYSRATAFVLPTRGEGWGRPFMESMACGVPVIATNWSAHLAFLNADNGYLVNADGLVTADATEMPLYAGQRWAQPSATHLAAQLRHVHADHAEARDIGARARRDMVAHWPWSRAAAAIAMRLTDIEAQLDRVSASRASHASHTAPTGTVVEGGTGDPMQPPSAAAEWLDVLLTSSADAFGNVVDAPAVSWRTANRGPRPPYTSASFAAWRAATTCIKRATTHITVLDDPHAHAPSAPAHGVWIVDVGCAVTDRVPPPLVTMLRSQADAVVVPHVAARHACLAIGVDSARVTIIASPVDTTRFTPVGASYRRSVQSRTRFMMIGSEPTLRALQHALSVFDRTFSSRDGVVLHVVLPESLPGDYATWRARLIADSEHGKRHPLLPRLWLDTNTIHVDECPARYRAADVLLVVDAAHDESTIREAMTCGVPVIAAAGAVADELLGDEWPWRVATDADGRCNPEALQHALGSATDVNARQRQRQVARERALTWSSRAEQHARRLALLTQLHSCAPRRVVGDPAPTDATAYALDGPRRVVLLAHVDWRRESALAVVRTYATACSADDAVTLALCLDPAQGVAVAEVERLVQDAMDASGRTRDALPDLLLVPDALDAHMLARLRLTADVVIAVDDPAGSASARRADRPVIESLHVASWRSAITRCLDTAHAA